MVRFPVSGSVTSAVLPISDLAGKTYFFKVLASTQSGPGKSTEPIRIVQGEPPYMIKTGIFNHCKNGNLHERLIFMNFKKGNIL